MTEHLDYDSIRADTVRRVAKLMAPRRSPAVRPIREIDPFRSIYATWMRGRRVPAVANMVEPR
jgi:hypothetical protein